MNRNGVDADLDAEWTYDNDGKLTTVRYPLGAVYQHGYDEMGRPKTMVDAGTQTTIVGSATYGPAGELLTMGNESRQYNSRLQVTRITYPTQDWEYKYSATQNNGQITAMKDWTSGEEVNYAYDELKRLASAVTVGPEWGNSYVYDGFGNLLQKNVVKGSAPYMNLSIDPATNKPYSGYSAAGLPTSGAGFDNDNRMISTTAGSSYPEYYAYSPAGKRVWNRGKRDIGGTWVDVEEVWFWGVTGQRMAFYSLTATGNPVFTLKSTNLYMGSKLVMSGGALVKTDRLGSVGKFYPWGEERTPTGVSGEKFATYYHDVQAAMNYADQRWHGTNGRFQVPDPYQAVSAAEPNGWNRFAYVEGDPTNWVDGTGLYREPIFGFDPAPPPVPPPVPPLLPPLPGPLPPTACPEIQDTGRCAPIPMMPIPPPRDDCQQKRDEIERKIGARRESGTVQEKGLAQRYDQLSNLPANALIGHVVQFVLQQRNLRKLLEAWPDECGDPPSGAGEWANKPVPNDVQIRVGKIIVGGIAATLLVAGVVLTLPESALVITTAAGNPITNPLLHKLVKGGVF